VQGGSIGSMNTGALEGVSKGSSKRWIFLGLATLSQVSVAAIRLGIPVLMPFIKGELNLSLTQVGLISSVVNGGAAAAGVPAGKAADRFGERLVLGYGTIASGIIILGISLVESFFGFLSVLLLTGFATTTCVPAGGRIVAAWFPQRERGTAMGVRQMGIPLGGAVAAVTLPSLAVIFGWRFALALAGVFAIGVGVVVLFLYQEPSAAAVNRGVRQTGTTTYLLAQKNIQALFLYGFILSAGQWCYLTYLVLYLTESLGLAIAIAANLLAVGQICGAGGRIFWGVVSDRFFYGRRTPALRLVGLLAVLATVSISSFSSQTPFWLVSLTVALLGVSLSGSNGLTHTLASELAGSRTAGIAVGMMNTAGFVGVIALTPVFGFFVDWGGSYRWAWIGLASMIVFAVAIVSWIDEKRVGEDGPSAV